MNKEDNSYKTISEVVKILNLKSKKGDSLPTHTLRFWEKEFKQIKPKILTGNRSCLLYTSPSPRDIPLSRMPSSA